MHPLLPRTMAIICYTGDICPECAGLCVISPEHLSSCCSHTVLQGKATLPALCILSNYISLPKVRFSYVCSVIKVTNLWQISLNSCIGICFTFFPPSLRTSVALESTKTSVKNKYLSVVTYDSFPPANLLLQLHLALLCPACPES